MYFNASVSSLCSSFRSSRDACAPSMNAQQSQSAAQLAILFLNDTENLCLIIMFEILWGGGYPPRDLLFYVFSQYVTGGFLCA